MKREYTTQLQSLYLSNASLCFKETRNTCKNVYPNKWARKRKFCIEDLSNQLHRSRSKNLYMEFDPNVPSITHDKWTCLSKVSIQKQNYVEQVGSLSTLMTLVLYDLQKPHLWYSQWNDAVPFLSQSLHNISCPSKVKFIECLRE